MPDETKPVAGSRKRRGNLPKSRKRGPIEVREPRFYYKGNRLKQLRAFCYTVKLGTLSRAAEALFLSPSSVSLQLGALEKELGALLLERRRRRVALTVQGGQRLVDARQIHL